MRAAILGLALFAAGCDGCNGNTEHPFGNGMGDMNYAWGDGGPPKVGELYISPPSATLQITYGGPAASQTFAVFVRGASSDDDVTSLATLTLGDLTLGTMSGGTFTTLGVHGGTTTLTATHDGMTATATIIVEVTGSFAGPDCQNCPAFPSGPTASPCPVATATPTLIYPPDGVLLPPNMENFSVHYLPAAGAQEYAVDFENASTHVRILHKCAMQPNDSRGMPAGGCVLDLTPQTWDFIAKSNRGGDAVKITVSSTPDGMCVATGSASVSVSFSEEDVTGGIYYWKSTVSANGTGGQVWRKEFGDSSPENQITNTGALNGTCFGCHFLSRDGQRMTVNGDDDDSDDEYSDVNSGLINVANKMFITMGTSRAGAGMSQPPGFQTFSPDHKLYLGSDGEASGANPNGFFIWDGDTGMAGMPTFVTAAMMGQRPTMPDWSADDRNVVYVIPAMFGTWKTRHDDDHVLGGSLWVLPHTAGTSFGAPVPLIQSQGENNYYPSYSPDGQFVLFNRVDKQTSTMPAANDSFSNPKAKIWVLPASGAAIECTRLNTPADVSNSWPRWSPFIQNYKGNRLLWVTFSSTRDYGVLVHNDPAKFIACYPPDSFEDPNGTHGQAFPNNCQQPQLWMAAINLSAAEFHTDDPSYPAFWLPFQDMTTHNHTAQWTTTVVTQPPVDGGTCYNVGDNCLANPGNCCVGICLGNGTCGVP